MKYWVGVTDKDWFDRLQSEAPEEVNFWQPSPRRLAALLEPGVPFLFKLHAPHDFIVGGGFFVSFSALPASLAWDTFETRNGVEDLGELRKRIARYRADSRSDPMIGCNILNHPFFLERKRWIPVPESWKRHTQRGRGFDTLESDGHRLWLHVEERLADDRVIAPGTAEGARYGADYLTQARLGQGAFRVLVTDAYSRRCAITGERTLPVLEAAHIKPYADDGPHQVSNGLLLRSDLHKLFDRGYITVTEDLHVEVSRTIKEEFKNGRDYYRHHGDRLLVVPAAPENCPDRYALRWHNEHRFKG